MASNYLPLLLCSVNAAAASDDSSLGPRATLPRGQVDYLSHHWREEDVWRSWRDMTRRKNEITNGARLENASWRTWWKQRNGLSTISPETLNWLKDSDVTWLYGPYHTAIDWDPPPKPKSDPDSVDKEDRPANDALDLVTSISESLRSPVLGPATKPILKHRSISELLSTPMPPSPPLEDDEDAEEDEESEPTPGYMARPSLLHTKSDSHIIRWRRAQAYRKDSPPRVHADQAILNANTHANANAPPTPDSGGSNSDPDSGSNGASSVPPSGQRKKHISFNTFVEQCIAIDTHPATAKGRTSSLNGTDARLYRAPYPSASDDEDDDDDVFESSASESASDSDDEDDVLEIKPRSRSNSSTSIAAATTAFAPMPTPLRRPTLSRSLSNDKEQPLTIAPIAPTMLKTSDEDNYAAPAQTQIGPGTLVYVPLSRTGSAYSLLSDRSRTESVEDVHVHRESRFAIGTGIPLPPSPYGRDGSRFAPGGVPSPGLSPRGDAFKSPPLPALNEEGEDYFSGLSSSPVYSHDFAVDAPRRSRSMRDIAGEVLNGMPEHDDGLSHQPLLIIGEGTEEMMEHSGSGLNLHSSPVPVPGVGRTPNARFLSPDSNNSLSTSPNKADRGRGRSRSRSMSGSTDSISFSGSNGSGERESRGRSQSRTPGGDRSRSTSRVSGNGNSPLGSLSPSSSMQAVSGAAYASGRERGRETRVRTRAGSSDSLNAPDARGRGPRRMGDSLSPPSLMGAGSSVVAGSAGASMGGQKRTLGPLPEEAGPSTSIAVHSPAVFSTSTSSSSTAMASSSASTSSTATSTPLPTPRPSNKSSSRSGPPPNIPIPPPQIRTSSDDRQWSSSPKSARRLSGQILSPNLLNLAPPAPVPPRETTSVSPPSLSPATVAPALPVKLDPSPSPPSRGRDSKVSSKSQSPSSTTPRPADSSLRIRKSTGSSSPTSRADGNGIISGRAVDIVQNTRSFLSSLWNPA